MSRLMNNLFHLLSLLLLLVLVLSGCDNDGSVQMFEPGPLPPDPADWVCEPSLNLKVRQEEIKVLCQNTDRGDSAPIDLQIPPPLAELMMKNDFDEAYQNFLRNRVYDTELGWIRDIGWRMTGPYAGTIGSGKTFGKHPGAVRIFYSPEIIDWLCRDRVDPIPDGAMIVKEMHTIDESLDITINLEGCMLIQADVSPTVWTVMIKASDASHDGWYYGVYFSEPQQPVPPWRKGNPPILNRSAITSEKDFFGDSPDPTERNPRWYPTGLVIPGIMAKNVC